MGQWLETLTQWLAGHPQWLGLALLIVACMECLAVVGLIIPGTVLVFAIAVLAGSGVLSLGETLLLGFIGGLIGDLLSYALGRRYHQGIRSLRGLRDHPEWLVQAEHYFQRYGVASLLVGRFIGPLRPMLPMTAGMLDMPFGRFLLVSLCAAAGWSMAYLLPGWSAGAAIRLPLEEGFWSEAGIVVGALLTLIAATAFGSLRGLRWVSALSAGLGVAILLGLFFGWPHLKELDEGLLAVIQGARSTTFDRIMVIVTRAGDFHTQLWAAVLLCLLLLVARQWRAALFAILTLLGTALANGALKATFARVRPEVLMEPLSSYSFPSGHSSAAFAFFLTLGVLAGRGQPPRLRLAWLVLASLPATAIALSRVYLGVHWTTDVTAGALLAASICAASLTLLQWRSPLHAMAPRVWWLILPACLGLLGAFSVWALPTAMQMYRYQ
ncbi:PAP2 family protein/DedA family protein [Stutzerimonas stutzeri]|uniref:bifunctional DedA family/phosphatase PAP2 family protein n=1 Tax=Stutzerimonas stutzeri subgroup TaxID=578833 RepID=UPI000C6D83EE|nr:MULTISPECIES: bifunctional DedA family/phosphatase PAP2 family protein [Stutzerimonas stutzeri subgroup]MCQ2045583.1 bifunctional DedA family/phosphatase PAP2 family protein [Stutzerimonas kunmingensis]PKR27492.1 phosphoesterase [Stutzerimonas stutzeri]QQC11134.1 bifunctional DedA family/phosphatase PAP2 family protein [Stutzerimonas stutzeri]VEI30715.1 PAP2 family protein/DedA family protein [Stutzerimonas stutzeri]